MIPRISRLIFAEKQVLRGAIGVQRANCPISKEGSDRALMEHYCVDFFAGLISAWLFPSRTSSTDHLHQPEESKKTNSEEECAPETIFDVA